MSSACHRSRISPPPDRPRGISQQTIPRCFFYLAQLRLTRKSTTAASLSSFPASYSIRRRKGADPSVGSTPSTKCNCVARMPAVRPNFPAAVSSEAGYFSANTGVTEYRQEEIPPIVFPDKRTPAAARSLIPSTMPPSHPMNNPVHNTRGNKPGDAGSGST
jgi:hypothetical protein